MFLVSFAIAWLLSRLNHWLVDWKAPLAVVMFASCLFLPRSEIMDPISAGIKDCGSLAISLFLILGLHLCNLLWKGTPLGRGASSSSA